MNLRLRERREAQGLSQKELAQKVGKSFRTIQSWEREESYPTGLPLDPPVAIPHTDGTHVKHDVIVCIRNGKC